MSEADSGDGTIQRRDPSTGTLLASHPMLGVIAPLIGGVSAAGAPRFRCPTWARTT